MLTTDLSTTTSGRKDAMSFLIYCEQPIGVVRQSSRCQVGIA